MPLLFLLIGAIVWIFSLGTSNDDMKKKMRRVRSFRKKKAKQNV